MDNIKEYIICAANHYDDDTFHIHQPTNITSGYVIAGHRHHNCIYTFSLIQKNADREATVKLIRNGTQGFLTDTNRFVGRIEALEIAKAADQLISRHGQNDLYSEDLY